MPSERAGQTERVAVGRLIPGDQICTAGSPLVVRDIARVGLVVIVYFQDSRRPLRCTATTHLIRKLRKGANT